MRDLPLPGVLGARPGDQEYLAGDQVGIITWSWACRVPFQAAPGRWHGLLGRGADGEPLLKPTPLPPGSETMEFKAQAHMGQCYNAAKSVPWPCLGPRMP